MKLGIPVTPYFKDLDKTEVYCMNQIKFHSGVILPLFKAADNFVAGKLKWSIQTVEDIVKGFEKELEEYQERQRNRRIGGDLDRS